MAHRLPEKGLWQVADPKNAGRHHVDAAPFDLIKLELRGGETGTAKGTLKGTVRARNLETRLGRIRLTAPDRFAAVYDIRGHRGVVEGTLRPDGSLRLVVSGTVTGTFVARDAGPIAAEPARADAPSALMAFAGAVDALRRPAGLARSAA
jgi:hypothetical protein